MRLTDKGVLTSPDTVIHTSIFSTAHGQHLKIRIPSASPATVIRGPVLPASPHHGHGQSVPGHFHRTVRWGQERGRRRDAERTLTPRRRGVGIGSSPPPLVFRSGQQRELQAGTRLRGQGRRGVHLKSIAVTQGLVGFESHDGAGHFLHVAAAAARAGGIALAGPAVFFASLPGLDNPGQAVLGSAGVLRSGADAVALGGGRHCPGFAGAGQILFYEAACRRIKVDVLASTGHEHVQTVAVVWIFTQVKILPLEWSGVGVDIRILTRLFSVFRGQYYGCTLSVDGQTGHRKDLFDVVRRLDTQRDRIIRGFPRVQPAVVLPDVTMYMVVVVVVFAVASDTDQGDTGPRIIADIVSWRSIAAPIARRNIPSAEYPIFRMVLIPWTRFSLGPGLLGDKARSDVLLDVDRCFGMWPHIRLKKYYVIVGPLILVLVNYISLE